MKFLNYLFCFTILSPVFSSSQTEIEKAAQENKTVMLFFYKESNEKTTNLEQVFDQTAKTLQDEAKFIKVKANDPLEGELIKRFDLKRTPMPFVLVLAPNGAVTGGFSSFDEQQLINSLSSKGAANCLKALQTRKLVLLCLQNSETSDNEAALNGAKEFQADPRFASATELVIINPADVKEEKFLQQLGVDTHCSQATTILLSPPGEVIGTYKGAVTKATLTKEIECASSGCCAGGCCPGGKCGKGKK